MAVLFNYYWCTNLTIIINLFALCGVSQQQKKSSIESDSYKGAFAQLLDVQSILLGTVNAPRSLATT